MRAVLQRVSQASVSVDGDVVGRLELPPPAQGLVALVGVTHDDTVDDATWLADKIWQLRILDGPDGGQASAADLGAPILVISQFTLYANTAKGRRPSWNAAAPGPIAQPLVDAVVAGLRESGATVATGTFGAHMEVELVNDGPVTIVLDTPSR
ncbi:D-tyrosyl-tRNA(Tyr) deacylase [Gordonia effusa NBRC 100432]|uniref:D-aminoacyl-tRNA deacylase n=1 Tax=Gordonia effusa NBRC 100432 TaxID=1077974 RepID=H0R492_9ACTN|nr:D-aminoacyl-tRNA deacylase [Gordonia effusa]GAB19893.1 D-tyrosyl-tRNA(Tyr) deacylase [Gordonia effusa NBRC 100432]